MAAELQLSTEQCTVLQCAGTEVALRVDLRTYLRVEIRITFRVEAGLEAQEASAAEPRESLGEPEAEPRGL